MSYTYVTNNTATTSNITFANGTTSSTWVNPVLTVQNAPAGLEVKGNVIINGERFPEEISGFYGNIVVKTPGGQILGRTYIK